MSSNDFVSALGVFDQIESQLDILCAETSTKVAALEHELKLSREQLQDTQLELSGCREKVAAQTRDLEAMADAGKAVMKSSFVREMRLRAAIEIYDSRSGQLDYSEVVQLLRRLL